MTFSDIFKKSFLAGYSTATLTLKGIVFSFAMSVIFGAYIFAVYRIITRKTFYDKNFNISLAAISVVVTSIILTIQSSIVVSLGMVGALSIVRFRTAIKNPLDLVFLFWSISVGIICGAGLPGIALFASAILTAGILILDRLPVAKTPMLLIVNCDVPSETENILASVNKETKVCNIKSKTIQKGKLSLIIEVRTSSECALVETISQINGVTRCSLVSHDGEVTF